MKKITTFITAAFFATMSYAQTADVAQNVFGADIGDFNGLQDFEFAFDSANDQSNITEYRLMVVKNGATFNVDSAVNVLAANYMMYAAPLADNVVDTLMDFATDTDGDTILMNTPYQVYVLSIGTNADSLSSASASVTLMDNIVGFPFSEDFEGGSIPSTWSLFDEDGDGYDWRISDGVNEDAIGTFALIGASWEPGGVGSLNPDNYMMMPAMDLSDVGGASVIELAWSVYCINQNFTGDFYEIYVSTTGNEVADFTPATSVFSEAIPGSAGFMERSVDLSTFIGDTVWIAWRHHNSNDIERFAIDEISLRERPAFDITIGNVSFNNEYPIMPQFQLTSGYTFSADITNNGASDATGVTMEIDVNSGEFLETVVGGGILSGANTSLSTVNAYSPLDTGTYVVEFGALMDSVDENTANNVAIDAFRVTEMTMGRDKGLGSYEATFGIGAGADGILGQKFDVISDVNLLSVDVFLVAPTIGDTIRVEIYDLLGSTPGLLMAQSAAYTIQTADAGWRTIELNAGSGAQLFAGSYVIGVHEFQENITLGTSSQNFLPNTNWIFYQGAWSTGESDGFEFIYFLRANMEEYVPVENGIEANLTTISVSPNPANDVVTLKNVEGFSTVEVIDITGKMVLSLNTNNAKSATLNVSELEAGIYIVKASGDNNVSTQKLIIE